MISENPAFLFHGMQISVKNHTEVLIVCAALEGGREIRMNDYVKKIKEFFTEGKKKDWLKEIGMSRLVTILLCGILLLVIALPDGFLAGGEGMVPGSGVKKTGEEKAGKTAEDKTGETMDYVMQMEERLSELLENVEGVGKVKVMVTLAASEEELTLKDEPYSHDTIKETDAAGGSRSSISVNKEEASVLVENESGQSVPYVTKTVEPEVEGIVVIAEGAGQAKIENEIIEAVEVLFPVAVHKIKVMKMR